MARGQWPPPICVAMLRCVCARVRACVCVCKGLSTFSRLHVFEDLENSANLGPHYLHPQCHTLWRHKKRLGSTYVSLYIYCFRVEGRILVASTPYTKRTLSV